MLPAFATANENLLLIVIPSTVTGMIASQAAVIVSVVVNVIVGADVPLFSTVAEMPVGQVILLESTVTDEHWLLPQYATACVAHLSPAGAPDVFPTKVYASDVKMILYASVTSITVT